MVPAVKASYLAVAISYFAVAAFGAAAFGESVADDVLLSAGAGPAALVALANAAVCLHVAAGFHVFSQPCYSRFEEFFEKRWWLGRRGAPLPLASSLSTKAPSSLPVTTTKADGATAAAAVASPSSSAATKTTSGPAAAARLCYVLLVAAAAAALPFFSVCTSLVGALAFAPATFVLPPAFAYFAPSGASASSSRRSGRRRTLHGAMALAFGVLSLACSASAARGLVLALQSRLRGLAV